MSEQSGTPDPRQPHPGVAQQPPQPGPYGATPEGSSHPWPYGQAPPPPSSPYAAPQLPAYGQAGYGQPGLPMPGYGPPMRDPDARPGTVLAAGILTLVMSGLTLLMTLVFALFLVAARESFLQGVSRSADIATTGWLYGVLLVVFLVFALWCVAAIVLAVLTLRRRNWARICLVVSAGFTALLSLVGITSGVSVVTLAGAVAVIVLLFTGGAGDWFHREHAYSPPRMPPV